jgi:hypothetical protein
MTALTTQKADTRKTTALLKKHLKSTFGIVASVRTETYAGGSSMRVRYDLGPAAKLVEPIVKNLQYGAFDSMIDLAYNVDNAGLVIDGFELESFKYVFVDQDLPGALKYRMAQFLSDNINLTGVHKLSGIDEFVTSRTFGERVWNAWSWNDLFHQLFRVRNFVTQDESKIELKSVHFSETSNGVYFIYTVDGKEYNTEQYPAPATEPVPELGADQAQPAPAAGCEILPYSERSFIVIGETKNIKDQLKNAGGRFNRFLTHPQNGNKVAGWVFPTKQLESVIALLNL